MMLKAPFDKRELGMNLYPEEGVRFLFWSPTASSTGLEVTNKGYFPLDRKDYGYWEGSFPEINSGDRYMVVIDKNKKIPDPVSLSQPDGVHAASEVIDTFALFQKTKVWEGFDPANLIIYELHTGTFSPKGSFQGIIEKLDYLVDLGINAIELMPVAQFPGSRNWGYDGVYPFAVQQSYGGAKGLAELVTACHVKGIAVILDVVYNHLGPEGNYLPVAGPYLTDKYRTPWGSAINFDDEWCDGVRRYFIENALMWLRDFGIDGLRLDAVHAIKDNSTLHFLAELAGSVEKLNCQTGSNHFLIGECDLNDVRYISPANEGGMGLDAQWCDEFHHALHALITGERQGYYTDFGNLSSLTDSFNNAYVYNGKFSEHRKKLFGNSTNGIPGNRFVVFTQNHDQTGNRMSGERLSSLVDYESLKLAAAAMILSPFAPMLFMGEEYGEDAPFLYFTSHSDTELIEAVREGRKREFKEFMTGDEPPDAHDEDTFKRSMLSWNIDSDEKRKKLLEYYKLLIRLKKSHPALKPGNRENVTAFGAGDGSAIILRMPVQPGDLNTGEIEYNGINNEIDSDAIIGQVECDAITVLMNFSEDCTEIPLTGSSNGRCNLLLYSAHKRWGGPVSEFESLTAGGGTIIMQPRSVILLEDRYD